jgi:hypothetical protein
MVDTLPKPESPKTAPRDLPPLPGGGLRPGEDFDQRGDWAEILQGIFSPLITRGHHVLGMGRRQPRREGHHRTRRRQGPVVRLHDQQRLPGGDPVLQVRRLHPYQARRHRPDPLQAGRGRAPGAAVRVRAAAATPVDRAPAGQPLQRRLVRPRPGRRPRRERHRRRRTRPANRLGPARVGHHQRGRWHRRRPGADGQRQAARPVQAQRRPLLGPPGRQRVAARAAARHGQPARVPGRPRRQLHRQAGPADRGPGGRPRTVHAQELRHDPRPQGLAAARAEGHRHLARHPPRRLSTPGARVRPGDRPVPPAARTAATAPAAGHTGKPGASQRDRPRPDAGRLPVGAGLRPGALSWAPY